MTHYPKDDELEAQACVLLSYAETCAASNLTALAKRLEDAAALTAYPPSNPPPDARQEGWNAGIEAAAKAARDCVYYDSAGNGFDEDKFAAAIRALAEKGPPHAP